MECGVYPYYSTDVGVKGQINVGSSCSAGKRKRDFLTGTIGAGVPGDEDSHDQALLPCPRCGGFGKVKVNDGVPRWVSFISSAEGLYAILKDNHVDEAACQSVMLLLQKFGDDGLAPMRDLVGNLLQNWRNIKNPSAFIAGGCAKYRQKAEPKENQDRHRNLNV